MMQAGVRLRQDTEMTLPELPEQHRIREKEEELHGLESVHMAESETKCTAPGLNTLEPECVTANSRVSDLHHTEASVIKTETDLSFSNTGVLKTESLDFTELAFVTHLYPEQVKTETVDGDDIKTEDISILPDIKCVDIKSDYVKLESSEILLSDFMKTELNGAGVDGKVETDLYHCAGQPNPICKKSQKNQSDLMHDVAVYIREKPHECLQYHNLFHTGEKPYKCDHCGKSFALKSHLKEHHNIHTDERPYKCNQCEETFSLKSVLKSHQRIHADEKPFKCDQCAKHFKDKRTLQRHYQIHAGERPYKCNQCEKSFLMKSYLTSHHRTHTGEKPYSCDCCGKSFSAKSQLTDHHNIHTGEKPYKCNQCEKSFFMKYLLKSHQRIHLDEMPFKNVIWQ
ncbi:hypothetical protein GJAV_G00087920, partial [Gymnothorax javanicus]